MGAEGRITRDGSDPRSTIDRAGHFTELKYGGPDISLYHSINRVICTYNKSISVNKSKIECKIMKTNIVSSSAS